MRTVMNKQEVVEAVMASKGKGMLDTVEEIKLNIFDTPDNHITNEEKDAAIICAIVDKIAKIVSENNKRITEQLISAGIKLSV